MEQQLPHICPESEVKSITTTDNTLVEIGDDFGFNGQTL